MSFTPKLRSEYNLHYNLMKIQTGWAIDLNLNCRLDSLNFNQFVSSEICSEGVEKVVSKYGDYKNSDGISSDGKSGDYSTNIY